MPTSPTPRRRALRASFVRLIAAAGVLGLTACTSATPTPTPTTTTAPASSEAPEVDGDPTQATFTFGTAANPTGLDPALVADTESYRITRQILEGLVGIDPLTSEPAPLLATSWEERDDGRAYAFELRNDVVFHDGEPFNAEAVCANFERWHTMPAGTRELDATISFQSVFKAFSDEPEDSVYESCQPLGEYEVLISLTGRHTTFIPALALPAFGMASPKALEEKGANELTVERDGRRLSEFALSPVGTGPFRFESWSGDEVTLSAFEDYWGNPGEIQIVTFRTIPHTDARLRALISGEIDGYDLVTVDNAAELAREGQQILQRDPYSVLYLGMNQDFPGVDDILFRQAVAHAVDKNALIENLFLEGTSPANQFIPPKLGLPVEDVATYEYDPELARELLGESGYTGEPLPFHYPRNVSRPYLSSPEKVYAELSRQLTEAGFNLQPMPTEWSEGYVETVQNTDNRAFHLLGWSGSYQDPDNFVGALFGSYSEEFAYRDNQLFSKIARAVTLPNGEERTAAYQDISQSIADDIPALPLAFPVSAAVVSPRVLSYPVSPVMHEVFNNIDLADVELPTPDDDV
ncbi:peptide/nickel transport system substrate-binding protein [Arthrobacter pigmenti]|uniref:Peptide/nickel transport system substrate-binding protein n=1 Tax=Arthrobacter pigmenti TaxID=271432 RepID=A0A846RUQ9_9MICC|nr:ABC transporter substrate-binding protein [Arthrobacter pigmenti]NJC22756.1 peptide/nickel transport system substrate-binding protein [Arthrobacter pigmenti]